MNDSYLIVVKLADFDTAPFTNMNIGFVMRDSIHQIFPEVNFAYNDAGGLAKEYGVFSYGMPLEVGIVRNEEVIKNRYIVSNYTSEGNNTYGKMDGAINIHALHEWYNFQNAVSASYDNRISEIIKDLVSDYSFNAVNIDGTSNSQIWYRPFIKEAAFIKDCLLPSAFSEKSNNSPFFCWIDNLGHFNFRSFFEMFDQSPVDTLFLLGSSFMIPNSIIKIFPYTTDCKKYAYLQKRKIFYIDEDTGDLVEEEDSLKDYPKNIKGKVPLYKTNDNLNTQSILFLGEENKIKSDKENQDGIKFNSIRNGLFLERIMLTTLGNLNLRAGQTVNLEINSSKDDDAQFKNDYFSGKWLIEESKFIWDTKQAHSEIVCARQKSEVVSDYLAKKTL
ncbi:MAG: hypothetical protein GF311_28490 [Candidatus Lokiarchaeota archaeon]|nr:hypothetical protein [Candidatus Lokiarchaeota archaeon]